MAAKKRAAYMLDGQRLDAKTFPIREYNLMGLWNEHLHEINGTKSSDWESPSLISEDQARRLYKCSPPLRRRPWEWDDL